MRSRPLHDFRSALAFLTALPAGTASQERTSDASAGFYPAVGWVMGLVALAIVGVARLVDPDLWRNSLVLAVIVVGAWALLTRFLHWDGLADAADGLLGSQHPEERLEIMRDSRVGAFGASAVAFLALLQTASVGSLIANETHWPLLAAPVVGRASATLACWTLLPARPEGLGSDSISQPGLYPRIVAALAVLLAAGVAVGEVWLVGGDPWDFVRLGIVFIVVDLAALIVPRELAESVGGVTGDILGATILIVETTVLVAAALVV